MIWQYVLVACGGALGAMSRFATGIWVREHITDSWPAATLTVNVLGSIGLGTVFVLLERGMLHADGRSLLVVGFFGAFTTFSTFSLELLHMIERGESMHALLYALLSLMACLLGVTAGVLLSRAFG